MASLQDQLLKAGLVDKNKLNKAKKDNQKKARLARNSSKDETSEVVSKAEQKRANKVKRDRELNVQKQETLTQKAIAAQIIQLVEMNRLDSSQGEIEYSFVFNNKINQIHLDDNLKQQLIAGRLAIVTIVKSGKRQFELVPAPVAEKIAQRDPLVIVQLHDVSGDEGEDDAYADYKIPDDLMW